MQVTERRISNAGNHKGFNNAHARFNNAQARFCKFIFPTKFILDPKMSINARIDIRLNYMPTFLMETNYNTMPKNIKRKTFLERFKLFDKNILSLVIGIKSFLNIVSE